MSYSNGRPFTTGDRDNDELNGNCATNVGRRGSGWWYGACEKASLTLHRRLKNDRTKISERFMQWETWQSSPYSIKAASMMIRRM